jgi:hypothetical protein
VLTDQYFGQARPLGWARALFKIGAGVSLRELVYLHYVLDPWADWRRKPHALGDVVIVRFAGDPTWLPGTRTTTAP